MVAALMFATPKSMREVAERRDKIHSQALNFALLSTATFYCFEPLQSRASSNFTACGLQSASSRLNLKQGLCSLALKFAAAFINNA